MKKLLFILFIITLMVSCSSSEKSVKEKKTVELDEIELQEVRLEVKSLNSWVNLMPGADSKFHISGELIVEENFRYNLVFMNIERIKIIQSGLVIYSITPLVQVDEDLSDDNSKYIRFSTVRGLSRDPRLDIEGYLQFEIDFYDGNESYTYIVENVKINKVY